MSRLIVKNLPLKITEDKLRNTFSSKGSITDLQLKFNKDGKFRGFAFLGFKTDEEADAALKFFNGTYIGAAKITVEMCSNLGEHSKTKTSSTTETRKETNNLKTKEAKSILERYKDDAKFQEFLRIHKRNAESWSNESVIEVEQLYKEEHKDDNSAIVPIKDNSNIVQNNEKPSKLYFHVKLSNLPYKFKKKELKSFLSPLKPPSVRFPPKNHGIAFVGFKTEKERNLALNKHKSLWKGHQIFVVKKENKEESICAESITDNPKWTKERDGLAETETIGDSGRIYVRNLSYTVTEEDLRSLFNKYGPLAEVNLPIDKITRRSKGFAFITFVMPEHAVSAFAELDGTSYQGRLLHLIPAKSKDNEEEVSEESNFKKKKAIKQKKDANMGHNWNSLFLGLSAVADLMTEKYDVSKMDVVLGESNKGKTPAVRLALGETQIIQDTKKYLESEGVRLQAFDEPAKVRSKTIIIAKNLPANTNPAEIRDLFIKYGVLGRVLLPPGGICAVIEFEDPGEARSAFTNLAYTRFHSVPLYLEWAPQDTFSTPFSATPKAGLAKLEDVGQSDLCPDPNDETPDLNSTLFVKNLNFETTDASLKSHFSKCGKVYSCNVATRKEPKTGMKLSMGFGFVTFLRKVSADKALREMQHSRLDDHALELKRSNRAPESGSTYSKAREKSSGTPTTKILVRNVAFQATKDEICEIFKTYGELAAIRLPTKMTGSGSHRGFAFIEFTNKSDAKKAMEELSGSTHLYGRRLVLEWADQEESLDSLRKRTCEQFNAGSISSSKRKKFEMSAIEPDTSCE